MKNFIWRTRARVVAYVNMILWISFLMATILFILDVKLVERDPIQPSAVQYCHDWFIVALQALITGLQLWASLKLLSATEFGRNINEAMENARIWRNVTVAFLFMVIFCAIFRACDVAIVVAADGWGSVPQIWRIMGIIALIIGIIYILWCGISLLVVYKYMKDLETAIPTGGTAFGDVCSEWVCCGVTCTRMLAD